MIGGEVCGVDKEKSAGILFDHSQDTEYIQSSIQRSENYESMERAVASAVSSLGNSTIIEKLTLLERRLYKIYQEDRTSDESDTPTKVTNKEVAGA